jgi:hypothetical protein
MTREMREDAQMQRPAVHCAVAPMNTDSSAIIRTFCCREQPKPGRLRYTIAGRSFRHLLIKYIWRARDNLSPFAHYLKKVPELSCRAGKAVPMRAQCCRSSTRPGRQIAMLSHSTQRTTGIRLPTPESATSATECRCHGSNPPGVRRFTVVHFAPYSIRPPQLDSSWPP